MGSAATSNDPVLAQRAAQTRARAASGPVGREMAMRVALGVVFAAGAGALASLTATHRHPAWWLYMAFVVGYALAASVDFDLGVGSVLPTELVFVPMLFVLPAPYVPAVVLAGLTLAAARDVVLGRLSAARALVWPPVTSLFALAPAAVFVAAREPQADRHGALILVVALASQFVVDACVGVAVVWFANRVPPRDLVQPLLWTFAIDTLLAPIGYLAAVGARVDLATLLLPVPLVAILALFARERRKHVDSVLELSSAYRGTALLLGDVIDADDAYTGDHSREVLDLVLSVADRFELDAHMRRLAEFAALLHDVGKIRVPSGIIRKKGPLTTEERAIVNTHTLEGERLLRRVGGLLAEVGSIVRSCHERWDGSGYPDGLAGHDIPLVARIICACDAYHAMTSNRPYRRALGHAAAVEELIRGSGTQFDAHVVAALLAVLEDRSDARRDDTTAAPLLACPRCGHRTMLDEPVQDTYRVCLRCGLVPIRVAS